MQGRAKVCKTKWAPEWLRNGEGALERVGEGLARDWQCRRRQWGLLCKSVQMCAKVCKGWWAPEWLRNAEGALERVGGGLARDWQCRRGQRGLLCNDVQNCARAGGHRSG